MILIKCGMQDEERVARELFPHALVWRGIRTVWRMDREAPKDVKAAVSFGVCGGLSPDAQRAQVLCATRVITDRETHECDLAWRQRIFAKTRLYTMPWYSSGDFDLADTPQQRAKMYRLNGAWCIDDESCALAEFAKLRGIPFIVFRSVSDDWRQTVPSAAKFGLDPGGGYDVIALVAEIVKQANLQFGTAGQIITTIQQAVQIETMARQYEQSLGALRQMASLVSPSFCWPT